MSGRGTERGQAHREKRQRSAESGGVEADGIEHHKVRIKAWEKQQIRRNVFEPVGIRIIWRQCFGRCKFKEMTHSAYSIKFS